MESLYVMYYIDGGEIQVVQPREGQIGETLAELRKWWPRAVPEGQWALSNGVVCWLEEVKSSG